jgi:hypothetical protein
VSSVAAELFVFLVAADLAVILSGGRRPALVKMWTSGSSTLPARSASSPFQRRC